MCNHTTRCTGFAAHDHVLIVCLLSSGLINAGLDYNIRWPGHVVYRALASAAAHFGIDLATSQLTSPIPNSP